MGHFYLKREVGSSSYSQFVVSTSRIFPAYFSFPCYAFLYKTSSLKYNFVAQQIIEK